MKQQTFNTFNEGMVKDLTPLVTPSNVLTDALNATIITFNGNEFQLQNDQGNCKVERARLSPGFVPVGMKEYGGIIYVASVNPDTGEDEIGCFPSPERDFSTKDFEFLSPTKFRTEDFLVNTGSPVVERLESSGRLMEPELFQLKPGDMYVVVYDINQPTVGTGDVVNNQTKMDEYISKDVLNRKLFKLQFYRISDDNSVNDINPDDIKVIANQPDIEDEYVYFKEPSKGVIAVALEYEEMDMFEANVVNRSRRTDTTKTVGIEAVGYSNSLANFEGVRVDVTSPEEESFYIDKTSTNKKVSAVISDLATDSVFRCSLTPYSKYSLYPKLKKEFQVDLGTTISAGAGVNNIYRWKTFDSYIKLDFDFAFEGDSEEGIQLYVEFYDPWSDYSVIKLVDNPTYYGTNSITLDLVNEPRSNTFNSINVGGTPATELIENTDTTYLKTVLASSSMIRRTSTLRANHFYVVRISGVEKVGGEYVHYDLYKGLYTTKMFNEEYDATLQLTVPDPLLDFNTYKFDLSALDFNGEVLNQTETVIPAYNQLIKGEAFTDVGSTRYYYLLKPTSDSTPVDDDLIVARVFGKEASKDIRITLEGTNSIFGDFKDELVTITAPTPGTYPPVVTDIGWDGNTATSPDSTSTISVDQVSPAVYKVKTSLTTKRKLATKIDETSAAGYKFAPNTDGGYPLARGLAYYEGSEPIPTASPANDGPAKVTRAALLLTLRMGDANNSNRKELWARLAWRLPITNGLGVTTLNSGWANGVHREGPLYNFDLYGGGKFYNDIEQAHTGDTGPKYSAYWTQFNFANIYSRSDNSGSKEYVTYYFPGAVSPFGHWGKTDPGPTDQWGIKGLVTMRTDNGDTAFIPMTDFERAKKFYADLRVGYRLRLNYRVFSHGTATIFDTGNTTTTAKFDNVTLTSKFTPQGPGKTYLSTFVQKAKNITTDFSSTILNNYIQERINLTNSVIIDDMKTVGEELIPYIESEVVVQNPIDVNDLVITQSSDASTLARINSGRADALASPSLSQPPSYVRAHGELFSVDPTVTQSLLNKFRVFPTFDNENTEVDPSKIHITLFSASDLGVKVRGNIIHGAWSDEDKQRAFFPHLLNDPIYRQ